MFDIFTSFSNFEPVIHDRSRSITRAQFPGDRTIRSDSSHGCSEPVLAAPPITHTSPSRKALGPLDSDLITGDLYTRPRGLGQTRSSWSLPPLISRSGALDPTHALDAIIETPPSSASPQSQDLENLPHNSYPSFPSKYTWGNTSSLTEERVKQVRKAEPSGRLAHWFQGSSDPISLKILPSPTKETAGFLDTMSTASANRPLNDRRKSGSQPPSKPPLASRFSFFTSKPAEQRPTSQPADLHDDLINLDIKKALFPGGPADPFSPAAFKNLVQNAEGLLSRLQAAYKERTISLHEMTAENETQTEELEGSETRAKHLKIQLDDMAAKLAKQDELMMDLVDDLAREKQLRREEDDVRKYNVALVKSSKADPFAQNAQSDSAVREQRPIRGTSVVSDSGIDSEEESYVESLCSKNRETMSPNASVSSFSTTNSPDGYILSESNPLAQPARLPPKHSPQVLSTFQNVIKGKLGGSRLSEPAMTPIDTPRSMCLNCQGGKASQAWSMVHRLEEENKVLQARLTHIE
ncbi:hypothetical protein MMC07_009058, partial [Pseudocyphellaria aurata]|nr:hypothetical protein [Pseudocyphellaria aurata]